MHPHLVLQNWWSQTESEVSTTVTPEAEITALEGRYGVRLPHDFREYLREGAPVAENWDAEDGNWWPIGRIRSVPDEYPHPVGEGVARNAAQHLFFLDYSIWSWAWAISCADDETRGKIAVIGGGGLADGYVADSFSEFVDAYTSDWMSVSQVQTVGPMDRFRAWINRE